MSDKPTYRNLQNMVAHIPGDFRDWDDRDQKEYMTAFENHDVERMWYAMRNARHYLERMKGQGDE